MTTPVTANETRSEPSPARRILFSLLCAAAMGGAGTAACSSSGGSGEDDSDDGAGVDAGGGGDDGSGGGGDDGTGDDGGDEGGDDGGQDADCPLGQPQDPSGLAECCTEFGPAHCLPGDQLDPQATEQLAACEDGSSYCAPDTWIEGNVELVDCTSVLDEPGVCLSRCIPLVEENAANLPQDICPTNELCAPCINPLTGESTGACELDLSCDAPDDPPGDDPPGDPPDDPGAEACCDSRGTCVPAELAGEDADSLEQDTCSQEDFLCAPNPLIDDSFVAEPCESTIGGLGGDPAGACMHDCLANTGIFLQDGCADGFKCVACELPILGETGACDFLPGN